MWNIIVFVVFLFIIVLFMDKNLSSIIFVSFVVLYGFIVVVFIGLVGVYVVGSCSEVDVIIYVVFLVGVVFVSMFL